MITTKHRSITELLELIETAKANDEIAVFAAAITDEEELLLWQHELETVALPRLEQAQARLALATAEHDLKAIERAQWRVQTAQDHVNRCRKSIANIEQLKQGLNR